MALLEPFVLYFIIFDLWYLQYTQIKGNCCISPQLFLCVFFNYRFLPVLVTYEQNNVDENVDLKIHKMFDLYLVKTKSKVHRSLERCLERFLERIYPKICQKICPKLWSIITKDWIISRKIQSKDIFKCFAL